MQLSEQQSRWASGADGPALQWATTFNQDLGLFFGAREMVPVASAHFAPDTRMGGKVGLDLLRRMARDGARVQIPASLDPCMVDFGRAAEFVAKYGMSEAFVASDRETYKLCKKLGFQPTYSCVNYQTVQAPRRDQALAWGDTGAAICANAIFGARTNFEGGPSALASALIGYTPAYGMHLDQCRKGNLPVRLECQPGEIADWGAIAACTGAVSPGYFTVPVFYGDFEKPSFDMLKQLGVALASYGGHAMFHVVGVTPEAPTIEMACGGAVPGQEHVITQDMLDTNFRQKMGRGDLVDLVVFAAPQLSLEEVRAITDALDGRRIAHSTDMILAVDPQVYDTATRDGLLARLESAGVTISTGTCFYPEAPLIKQGRGWKTLATNSAKLVNTLAPSGFEVAHRRFDQCIEIAVAGRIP